jgi:hypothetical protein
MRPSAVARAKLAQIEQIATSPPPVVWKKPLLSILPPQDQSFAAYRLRGITTNHPEWIRLPGMGRFISLV